MKRNNGRRRHRGHNRKNLNNLNKNTVLESCGPISQVRGSAFQLNEKYSSLASEAQANDDKVLAESYLQFSDHYYRLNKEIEVAVEARMNDNPNLNKDNDSNEKSNLANGEEKTINQKPSRTDRSVKAKEIEDKENLNFDEKLPKKYSTKNQSEIQEANK